jgi:hypothetical protein
VNNFVIVGCSNRKILTTSLVPALDLYQGGYVPLIRTQVGRNPKLRERVFLLSAKYGLLGADDMVAYYDQPLTMDRAKELRPFVAQEAIRRFFTPRPPDEVLLIFEPMYLVMLADLLAHPSRPRFHWEPDIRGDFSYTFEVLCSWSWLRSDILGEIK